MATEKYFETSHWLTRHRGPFKLMVMRHNPKWKMPYHTEWLTGESSSEDVEGECEALMSDPKDTIIAVDVWSIREGCFVGFYNTKQVKVA